MATGIIAVQGAVEEHAAALDRLSAPHRLIRNPKDLTSDIDRLIFPGGESTAQKKLIIESGLFEPLKGLIDGGAPVLATCAGMILLSQRVKDGETLFETLPATVRRNGYGRQLASFSTVGSVGDISNFEMRFIRAPYVEKVLADDAEILSVTDNRITALKYHRIIATAFHPELTDDLRVHEWFLSL